MAAYVMNLLEESLLLLLVLVAVFLLILEGIIKRLRGNLSACFLTETYLAECRKKDRLQAQSFWVFKKEVEYVYYTCLIEEKYPHLSKEAFQQLFIQTKGAPESLAHFEKQDWFDWQALEHPETKKTTHESFRSFY